MSHVYRIDAPRAEVIEMAQITSDRLGNLDCSMEVSPDQFAPVIRRDGIERIVEMMRWGFPRPSGRHQETIIRDIDHHDWNFWLKKPMYRCLVPATAWYDQQTDLELDSTQYLASDRDDQLLAFIGIWRPWHGAQENLTGLNKRFALISNVASRRLTEPIPVAIFEQSDIDAWLFSDWESAKTLLDRCSKIGLFGH